MAHSSLNTTTPPKIIGKAVLYISLLLATMALLLGVSLWLYNQQVEKADFLHKQQIPFIKNNAQLMKSVAELENQLVAQQVAISQQALAQPLENVKQAWLEIVDLSRNHVLMVNDTLSDNTADVIAGTAQEYAEGYKQFVILVDDLLLTRQARTGQYAANSATLVDIINQVERIKQSKQNQVKQNSFDFLNRNNKISTEQLNLMLAVISDAQLYQYIYQELLKIQNQLTSLSTQVTPKKLNTISSQIASLTKNINQELKNRKVDSELKEVTDNIVTISNQFMGSGQLFAKWQSENVLVSEILDELSNYQQFLRKTATLIELPNFYDLPEFQLVLPIINIKVNESTMLPVGFVFILILISTSLFLAWRLLVLVNRAYIQGFEFNTDDIRQELQAEQALTLAEERHKLQLENIMNLGDDQPPKELESKQVNEEVMQPSFYKINNLIMDIEKYNQYHGSAEMAVFMLEDYVGRNQANLTKLKKAISSRNFDNIIHVNNAILKTANILSAPRIIKACENILDACEHQKLEQCVELAGEMSQAMLEVKQFIAEL